jgi:hypothetical protein
MNCPCRSGVTGLRMRAMELLPWMLHFSAVEAGRDRLVSMRSWRKRCGAKGARQLLYCFASLPSPCRPIKKITGPEGVGSQTTSSVAARLVGECVLNVAHR